MNRLLTFKRIDENGYALLEDRNGQTVAMPRQWMPKEARIGQTLHAVCITNQDVSSLFIEIEGDYHADTNERGTEQT
jgi:hypothetical protein